MLSMFTLLGRFVFHGIVLEKYFKFLMILDHGITLSVSKILVKIKIHSYDFHLPVTFDIHLNAMLVWDLSYIM